MKLARTLMFAASIALIGAALPTTAHAQRGHQRGDTARPIHVVDSGNGHGHSRDRGVVADRSMNRRAFLAAEALVDDARRRAAPFDEHTADRHVRLAESALDSARAEMGPFGNEYRFYGHLEDAEQHARAATSRVAELESELASLRRDAERELVRAQREAHGYHSSRAERMLDAAADELADGERAEWRGDYTDARAHYAAALEQAESATYLLAARPTYRTTTVHVDPRPRVVATTVTHRDTRYGRGDGRDSRHDDGCSSGRGGRRSY